jgi:hypothetical protein
MSRTNSDTVIISAQEVPCINDLAASIYRTLTLSEDMPLCNYDEDAIRRRCPSVSDAIVPNPDEIFTYYFKTPILLTLNPTPITWLSTNRFRATTLDLKLGVSGAAHAMIERLEMLCRQRMVDWIQTLPNYEEYKSSVGKTRSYVHDRTPDDDGAKFTFTTKLVAQLPQKQRGGNKKASKRVTTMSGVPLTVARALKLTSGKTVQVVICFEGIWLSKQSFGVMNFVTNLTTNVSVASDAEGELPAMVRVLTARKRTVPVAVTLEDGEVSENGVTPNKIARTDMP